MPLPEPADTDRSLRRAVVTSLDGMAFEAVTGSGHAIVLDAAPDHGGQDRGPSPTELLLVSLGGCTGMDVVSMLRKMRQDVTGYRVEVEGTRRDEHPRVYTSIQVQHVVRGRNLDPRQIARAVELSATRYCPVSAMLAAGADVTHTYRVEEESGSGLEADGNARAGIKSARPAGS